MSTVSAEEFSRRKRVASGIAMASYHAAHVYSGRGNVGGSVFRCVVGNLWLSDTSYRLQQVSEEVNRKCRLRNTMVQLSTPCTNP